MTESMRPLCCLWFVLDSRMGRCAVSALTRLPLPTFDWIGDGKSKPKEMVPIDIHCRQSACEKLTNGQSIRRTKSHTSTHGSRPTLKPRRGQRRIWRMPYVIPEAAKRAIKAAHKRIEKVNALKPPEPIVPHKEDV